MLVSLEANTGSLAVTRVHKKLDEVKGTMADSIDLALKGLSDTRKAEEESEELRDAATRFKRGAEKTERLMRCRQYKWTALIVLIVALVLTAIIVPIATSGGGS